MGNSSSHNLKRDINIVPKCVGREVLGDKKKEGESLESSGGAETPRPVVEALKYGQRLEQYRVHACKYECACICVIMCFGVCACLHVYMYMYVCVCVCVFGFCVCVCMCMCVFVIL